MKISALFIPLKNTGKYKYSPSLPDSSLKLKFPKTNESSQEQFPFNTLCFLSWDYATGRKTEDLGSTPGRDKRFLCSPVSRPALGPTQWVWGVLFHEANRQRMKLTTHFPLLSRLRMRGAISPLPPHICTACCLIKYRDFGRLSP
jgi:hypothetical protein